MRMPAMLILTVGLLVATGCSDNGTGDATNKGPATARTERAESRPVAPASAEQPSADLPAEPASRPAAATSAPARADLIPAGESAPDFAATDHQGQQVRLSDLLERQRVVLVFYPADFTSGCTKQLCAVRDDWSEFQKRGTTVLGVNPAGVEKHASFAEKYQFPFPVISDEGSRIAAAYGCKGKEYTKRAVYVIDRNGKVLLAETGMVPHAHIFAALDRQ